MIHFNVLELDSITFNVIPSNIIVESNMSYL